MNSRGFVALSLVLALVGSGCNGNGAVEPPARATSGSQAPTTSTTAVPTVAPATSQLVASTPTPPTSPPVPSTPASSITTTPPDPTPPDLVITAPEPGEVVATRNYRFEGTTEPGCTVTAAGRYAADVDAKGNWSIVLVLNPGGNLATFTASDPEGTTTEQRIAVFYSPPLTLRADGLGPFDFGAAVNDVADALNGSLGTPTSDEIVRDGFPEVDGIPTNRYWRSMWWDAYGLAVGFSDVGWRDDGIAHFTGWSYSGATLTTMEGIGPGSSVAALSVAFGDDLILAEELDPCTDKWEWSVRNPQDPEDDYGRTLRGTLSATPSDAAAVVTSMQAGVGSSC